LNDWHLFVSTSQKILHESAGQTYNIKVEANENTITVSLDGNVIMTYTDTDDPFLHGMVGYKSEVSEITVENLKISPLP